MFPKLSCLIPNLFVAAIHVLPSMLLKSLTLLRRVEPCAHVKLKKVAATGLSSAPSRSRRAIGPSYAHTIYVLEHEDGIDHIT